MSFELVPDPTIQRNFETLARQMIDTGGQSLGIRVGVAIITWPGGSPRSSNTTVTHGLGKTPAGVAFGAASGVAGSSTVFPVPAALSLGATTFAATAVTSDESSPAAASTCTVYWIAIG